MTQAVVHSSSLNSHESEKYWNMKNTVTCPFDSVCKSPADGDPQAILEERGHCFVGGVGTAKLVGQLVRQPAMPFHSPRVQ